MKNIYETPEMELVIFEAEDVISTSGGSLADKFVGKDDGDWGGLF